MTDKKKSAPILKAFDIIIESISFIVISYLLLNAMHAFRPTILWVLFCMTNVWLIQKYWRMLYKLLGSKILAVVVNVVSLLVLAGIFWLVGYLQIAPLPQKPW